MRSWPLSGSGESASAQSFGDAQADFLLGCCTRVLIANVSDFDLDGLHASGGSGVGKVLAHCSWFCRRWIRHLVS